MVKIHSILHSTENSLFHCQRRLMCKKPRSYPLDFCIWSILEAKVSATPRSSLDSLHAKLLKEWKAIPQEHMCAACDVFGGRLKTVIHNKESYIK